MDPIVSVIVPVYNMESYLRKCLDSLVMQSYKKMDIILIDDGSTDYSPIICDEYGDRYSFITVIHKSNGGLCSARNMGIQMAKGDWIVFIDSDDWCDCSYVENLVNGLKKYRTDVIISSFNYQKPDGSFEIRYDTFIKEGRYDESEAIDMAHALSVGCLRYQKDKWNNIVPPDGRNALPWNKLYNKEIILNNRLLFDEKTRVYEDALFNMHYFEHVKSIGYVDSKGYYYRYVDTGITKAFDYDRLKKKEYALNEMYEYSTNRNSKFFADALKQRCIEEIYNMCKYIELCNEYSINDRKKIVCECRRFIEAPLIHNSIYAIGINSIPSRKNRIAVYLAKNGWIDLLIFGIFIHKHLHIR